MRGKLEELGLREKYDEERKLHSGLKSKVFWDIEKLFTYPQWVIRKAIEEFVWRIGLLHPYWIVGIPIGGKLLASYVAEELGYSRHLVLGVPSWLNDNFLDEGYMIMDDVLTTGSTIRMLIGSTRKPDYIAVLVNRSGLDEMEGIPIISGIKCDEIEAI